MKLSAQEEYGIRCLLHMARRPEGASTTIPEISRSEGLSVPNVAKLMRLLRLGGFVTSARGQSGGYTLARSPDRITVSEVLSSLGGTLFSTGFCTRHAGSAAECVHSPDCSLRSLWSALQNIIEDVLGKTTLRDLICTEPQMEAGLASRHRVLHQVAAAATAQPTNAGAA